jgi:mRNA-degrading endonuclease toxin of MazEF toxin-antitoxin module
VPIEQGDIVWVRCADPRGTNVKRRPAVVVTANGDMRAGANIIGVAITSTLPSPLTDDYVQLPWHRQGLACTRLTRPCAAFCHWLLEIDLDQIDEKSGRVPGSVLKAIIERLGAT